MVKQLRQLLDKYRYNECGFHWIPRTHNVYADHICKLAKKYYHKNNIMYKNAGGDLNIKQMQLTQKLNIKSFTELKWK